MDLHEPHPARKDHRVGNDDDQPMLIPKPWRLAAGLWSLLALLAALALVSVVHHQQQQRRLAEQSFVRAELADKAYAALQTKLHSAEAMLRAVQTLFLASDEVTQSEFNSFYINLRPREQFPSLLALAYAQRETNAGEEHYITRWVEPDVGNHAEARR